MIRMREIYIIKWRQYVQDENGQWKNIEEKQIIKDHIIGEYDTFEEFIKNCNEIRNYKIEWILESLETGEPLSVNTSYDNPVPGVQGLVRSIILEEI